MNGNQNYGLHTKHINVSNTSEIMDKLSKALKLTASFQ